MSPGPFGGVVFEGSGESTLGTLALTLGVVVQADFDVQGIEIEVHGLNKPVFFETEQQGVMMGEIVHATRVLKTSPRYQPQRPQPRKSRKNRKKTPASAM
jgi:hypothetical protein